MDCGFYTNYARSDGAAAAVLAGGADPTDLDQLLLLSRLVKGTRFFGRKLE